MTTTFEQRGSTRRFAMTSPLRRIPEVIAGWKRLNDLADPVSRVGDRVLHGSLKNVLAGTWVGHPLHPLLTDATIGAWTSAAMLDVLGGEAAAGSAQMLVG